MESGTGSLHWLHGLEEYFGFMQEDQARNYILFVLKLLYANNPTIKSESDGSAEEFIGTVRKFAPNKHLDIFHKYFRYQGDGAVLCDAYSRGQVQSKIWLSTELSKINLDKPNVLILAGWFGQLVDYFKFDYNKIRIVDMDRTACTFSDNIFNLDKLTDFKVKSVCTDLNDIILQKTGYVLPVEDFKKEKVFEEKFLPNLIINTSAEHMDDSWYNQIRFKELESDPIVVIQSNNLFDIDEHINCVHTVDHMKKKFPMKEVLYEGELQLKGYKRFMLIGRP